MLHFKSKKACSIKMRELIYSIGVTSKVTDELLLTYIKQHPRWVGTDAGIERDGKYLRMYFAPHDVISWESILKPPPNAKSLYTQALRTSIMEQTRSYKKSCTTIQCEWCKSNTDIEVDHIYEFKNIVLDFEKKYNFPIPVDYGRNEKYHICFKETEIEVAFQTFHQEIATYRLLCRPCNIGRNKKIEINI